ncbi:MAG TPA: ABC transporter ATP-binding protein [Actinomycetota bacterium]|jgi:ATP-binding cassette subfamily B protein|nr:ABC transporter ATP-binding protein [Actinomycetota bacterium]
MSHHRLIIPDPDAPPITRATVRRVIRTFRPYRKTVTLVGALILITSAIGVINPLLIKVIFDQALFCGPGCPNLGLLYWLVGIMVAIPIASGSMGIWQSYLSNVVGQRVMQDLRNALYAHLQRMPLRFFTTTRTGEIQSRLSNDVGGIQSVVTDTASSVLANTVIVISSVVAMLILSWQLTLLSLGMMPFFIWLTQRVGKARREVAANTQRSLADLSAITEETLSVSGMLLSKAFGRQRHETNRFRRENERLAGLQIRQTMIGRSFFATIQIFFSVTPALVYLVAGFVLSGGGTELTAGDIVAFTTLQSRLFFPVGSLLQITVEVQSAMALFDRVFEYLDLSPEIEDAPDAVTLPREQAKGHVRFRNVSFRYEAPREEAPAGDGEAKDVSTAVPVGPDAPPGDGHRRLWTLEHVDLEIEKGTLAALVGPSGAGKTTVTYLAPRFYDVQRGSVEIDGIDVRKIRLASLGDVIGMVTQETYLFHTSVRENLRYGNPQATDEELEAAARAAFIHDRIAELPDGYDTLVGERGYKLSGGEKQRLAIARVILKDPRILILDEATSSLDSTSERLVQEALRPLMRGRTTIAIAHRLSTILAADVIFVLDRGRLVEQGTHSELLEKGGLYAHLYLQQFRGGTVEAETADGIVLTSGEIVPLSSQSESS